MKEERVIMAFLVAIAVALLLVIALRPISAHAYTAQQQAHLDWVNSLDAPTTTPAIVAKPATTGTAKVSHPVQIVDTDAAQRAQLTALIKRLQSLLDQLKALQAKQQ